MSLLLYALLFDILDAKLFEFSQQGGSLSSRPPKFGPLLSDRLLVSSDLII